MIYVEKFFPTEKGDKILMMYRKNEKFQFARFTLDSKDPKNKKICNFYTSLVYFLHTYVIHAL